MTEDSRSRSESMVKDGVEYQLISPVTSPVVSKRPSLIPPLPSRSLQGNNTCAILLFFCLVFLSVLGIAIIFVEENPVSQLTEWIYHTQFRPASNDDMSDGENDMEQLPDDEATQLFEQNQPELEVSFASSSTEEGNPISKPVIDLEEQRAKYGDLVSKLMNIYSPDVPMVAPIDACHPNNVSKVPKDSFEYQLLSADCGLGYKFENSSSKHHPWKVALYGPNLEDNNNILGLSGCLVGTGKCPYSPQCQIFTTKNQNQARTADVIVIFQNDANLINALPRRKDQYRVLYWREAFYAAPSPGTQKKFDFEMGVHWFSGLLNPQFFRTPASLLGGIRYPHRQEIPFLPVEQRPNFAMSVISNCRTASQRQTYIDRLVHYLGAKKIHQYGRCGNMQLPPPPIQNAAKIISSYKFYLSFENTIEDGYVTEKLLHLLAIPVVPVYYGSPSTPNITITPSFINVADFTHPKHLADYLMHLDANKEEYYKFHEWRTNPKLFHPEYLRIMQMKSPGPYEMLPLRKRGGKFYPRSAACCRLCDENYVRWAAEEEFEHERLVQHRMNKERIQRRFFEGNFFGDPKS